MTKTTIPDGVVREVVGEFQIDGALVELIPFERGHIHDTFLTVWRGESGERRFIHQRVNDKVFTDVPGLMHNIECVTSHLRKKLGDRPPAGELQTLRLVPTHLGRVFLAHESGPWRTYNFVENTRSYDHCTSPDQAYEAARAFGDFQAQLIDLDVSQLRETIPNFFSAPYRMRQFGDALESDPMGRAELAAKEVSFVHARRSMVTVIEERISAGAFPTRIVHGDTKLNNVLFDIPTEDAVCVVDLDTCMPAWSLYDFGDLVRFTAATSKEDEPDLSKAGTDLDLYRALRSGYLDTAGRFLTGEEIELMPFAARLVTFTIGLRFLTDYLAGDVYFKTAHDTHNLDRARVQFAMVESMERHEREMATR